jgi:phosphatidylglycerophosphatase A
MLAREGACRLAIFDGDIILWSVRQRHRNGTVTKLSTRCIGMSRYYERLRVIVATCGGFGYSPVFPGTMGALWGIALFVPIVVFVDSEPWQSMLIALALLVTCAITIALAPWAERHFQKKDSSVFVTDEVAGFLLTVLLFPAPWLPSPNVWITVLWAFPVTRVIDMIKVPPARRLEKLPAGWGVLADDLLGSVYAAIVLNVLLFFLPSWFGVAN